MKKNIIIIPMKNIEKIKFKIPKMFILNSIGLIFCIFWLLFLLITNFINNDINSIIRIIISLIIVFYLCITYFIDNIKNFKKQKKDILKKMTKSLKKIS